MSDSDNSDCFPLDLEESSAVSEKLRALSEKSKQKYDLAYERFEKWCQAKNITDITESVLLSYLEEKSNIHKPPTLWTEYCKVKLTLLSKKSIDLKKCSKILKFLKEKSQGHRVKQSKCFREEDIARFLIQADDQNNLMMKVMLIIGISGHCRREDLTQLLIEDVHDLGNFIVVTIPKTESKKARDFTITTGHIEGINFLEIIRKYIALRPNKKIVHGRFFLSYRVGKCSIQPVGINSIGAIPKKIATVLGLAEPEAYTGHCFRRTAASLPPLTKSISTIMGRKRWQLVEKDDIAEKMRKIAVPEENSVASVVSSESSSDFIPKSCAIIGCTSNERDTELEFFKLLPTKTDRVTGGELQLKNVYVCSAHFETGVSENGCEYVINTSGDNFQEAPGICSENDRDELLNDFIKQEEEEYEEEEMFMDDNSDVNDDEDTSEMPKQELTSDKHEEYEHERVEFAFKVLRDAISRRALNRPDSFALYGEYLASKLRNYAKETQRKVEESISNILVNADKGEFDQIRKKAQDVEPTI